MNMQNGNLFFIKGSNRATFSLRVTPVSPNYYESFSGSLKGMAEYVPLKKGEAVIFNNATIHGATDNISDDLRLAATLLVCSKQAEWVLHYRDQHVPGSRIEKYHLDLDTFIAMPSSDRPDKKAFKQYVSFEFPTMTEKEFIQKTGNGAEEERNYFKKVKEIFGLKFLK
jgi:hypothetical protein